MFLLFTLCQQPIIFPLFTWPKYSDAEGQFSTTYKKGRPFWDTISVLLEFEVEVSVEFNLYLGILFELDSVGGSNGKLLSYISMCFQFFRSKTT